jgi:hypothetical protein
LDSASDDCQFKGKLLRAGESRRFIGGGSMAKHVKSEGDQTRDYIEALLKESRKLRKTSDELLRRANELMQRGSSSASDLTDMALSVPEVVKE